MSVHGWQRYLGIEKDFIEAQYYVSFFNTNVFSEFFTREVILLGAEIEAALKELCKQLDCPYAGNMEQYKSIILNSYPGIRNIRIRNIQSNIVDKPFDEWNNGRLLWWDIYSKTKHNIVDQNATLQVALKMLQAFELLLFTITATSGSLSIEFQEMPKLFIPDFTSGLLMTTDMRFLVTFDRENLISQLRGELL